MWKFKINPPLDFDKKSHRESKMVVILSFPISFTLFYFYFTFFSFFYSFNSPKETLIKAKLKL